MIVEHAFDGGEDEGGILRDVDREAGDGVGGAQLEAEIGLADEDDARERWRTGELIEEGGADGALIDA